MPCDYGIMLMHTAATSSSASFTSFTDGSQSCYFDCCCCCFVVNMSHAIAGKLVKKMCTITKSSTFDFGWGSAASAPDPAGHRGSSQRSPRPLSGFKGSYF